MAKIQSQGDSELVQQAIQSFRQAKAHAGKLGMRRLLAHCHNGLGQVSIKKGKTSKARSELATAADQYRSMGMDLWMPQIQSAIKEIN